MQRHAAALLVAAFCLLAAEALGWSVTMAWRASTYAAVAGYRLYWGGVSGIYTNALDVGRVLSATASNLTPRATYYFAVTAYDTNGLESPFSNEARFVVLPPAPVLLEASATVEVPVWFWSSTNGANFWHIGDGLAWASFPMTNQAAMFYATPAGTNWPRLPLAITKGL